MIKGVPCDWAADRDDNIDPQKAVPVNDDKYPLTSSIYYGVRSYLHHFYEPSSRPFSNDESGMVGFPTVINSFITVLVIFFFVAFPD